MQKTHALRKPKRKVFILFLSLCLLLIVLCFLCNYYLLCLQREARIAKINDYTDYTLTFHEQKRCERREVFTYDDYTYYYDCLENVYLNYGTTQMTLEEAITDDYISLNTLTRNLKVTYEENQKVYYRASSIFASGYEITITNDNQVILKAL